MALLVERMERDGPLVCQESSCLLDRCFSCAKAKIDTEWVDAPLTVKEFREAYREQLGGTHIEKSLKHMSTYRQGSNPWA